MAIRSWRAGQKSVAEGASGAYNLWGGEVLTGAGVNTGRRVESERVDEMRQMVRNERQRGFTLIEMLVVVAIIGIMVVATMPGLTSMVRSNKMSTAQNLIESALGYAQAVAQREQVYAGVRFQYDAEGWPEGKQYLIIVRKADPYGDGYVALTEANPAALPAGVTCISGAVDLLNDRTDQEDYVDNAIDFDDVSNINNATTFMVLFGPEGGLSLQSSAFVRDNGETIFGEQADIANGDAVFYKDKSYSGYVVPEWCEVEASTDGLYICLTEDLTDMESGERYSGLLEQHEANEAVRRLYINPVTGLVLEERGIMP